MPVNRIHYTDADRKRMNEIMPFDTCLVCNHDIALHEWVQFGEESGDMIDCDRNYSKLTSSVSVAPDFIETVRYAKESGYLQEGLESIIRMINAMLPRYPDPVFSRAASDIREIRDEAQRMLQVITSGQFLQ